MPCAAPKYRSERFKGTINLDIRDSKPDWDAFLDRKAPKDAPNVLVVLYDDTGQAAWSPYGGRIDMPIMDRLAKSTNSFSTCVRLSRPSLAASWGPVASRC